MHCHNGVLFPISAQFSVTNGSNKRAICRLSTVVTLINVDYIPLQLYTVNNIGMYAYAWLTIKVNSYTRPSKSTQTISRHLHHLRQLHSLVPLHDYHNLAFLNTKQNQKYHLCFHSHGNVYKFIEVTQGFIHQTDIL